MRQITVGSLFSGILGFDLALERCGMKTVWAVEADKNCQKIIRKHSKAKVFDDVRTVGKKNLLPVDIIVGGFPCQDLSIAGKRKGMAGARSGLFYEMARIIYELNPTLVVWENVPGLLSSCSCSSCGRKCQSCGATAGEEEECLVCGSSKLRGRILPSHRGADFFAVVSTFGRLGYSGAWTLLDSQWFGVPQRRLRLFGVFARDDIGAEPCTEILSFRSRLSWDSAAGSETREVDPAGVGTGVTGSVSSKWAKGTGGPSGDETYNLIANPLSATARGWRGDLDNDTFVARPLRAHHRDTGGDDTDTLVVDARGNGDGKVVNTIAGDHGNRVTDYTPIVFQQNTRDEVRQLGGNVAGAIAAQPGAKQQNYVVGPLQAHSKEHGHAMTTQQAVESGQIIAFDPLAAGSSRTQIERTNDNALLYGGKPDAIAFMAGQGSDAGSIAASETVSPTLRGMNGGGNRTPSVSNFGGVRRLTPVECSRLQAFPDSWNEVGADGKPQSDSVRYRQLGNAVTVSVVEWIGHRIVKFFESQGS